MAGWTSPDRETTAWDGTISAKNFIGNGTLLTNLPAGTESDPKFQAASGAYNTHIASGAIHFTSYAIWESINSTSNAYVTHAADSSDPHGATLTQTNISSTTVSGAELFVTADQSTSGAAYVANIIYNTTSAAIVASNYPIGSLLVVYTV